MKYVVAKIKFRFEFPIDMLRYDSCFPRREEDSRIIADSLRGDLHGVGEVEIGKYCERGMKPDRAFTPGRWESFGAKVESVEVRP